MRIINSVTAPTNLKVIAGLHDRKNPVGGTVQLADVTFILRHPNFSESTMNNDIALLTVTNKTDDYNVYRI